MGKDTALTARHAKNKCGGRERPGASRVATEAAACGCGWDSQHFGAGLGEPEGVSGFKA